MSLIAKGVSKASDVSKYSNLDKGVNFSNKVLEHMGERGRQVPIKTLQDAIKKMPLNIARHYQTQEVEELQ